MKLHSHESLRGHISKETFCAAVREAWRLSSRYGEALLAHHAHSNDRPSLIKTMSEFIFDLKKECGFLSANDGVKILDVGCGNGQVAGRLLAALGFETEDSAAYVGIDRSDAMLAETRTGIHAETGPGIHVTLLRRDYADCNWNDLCDGASRGFHLIWLIHSGYYLEAGHNHLLESLEDITRPDGLIVLMHNPEGNAPYRAAAEHLGLPAYAFDYMREIRMPRVEPLIYDALRNNPGTLDEFERRFAGSQGARALRLLLEFYLPDYPLEELPGRERAEYVDKWRRHIEEEDGRFVNAHQMLVLLPRKHDAALKYCVQSSFERRRRW